MKVGDIVKSDDDGDVGFVVRIVKSNRPQLGQYDRHFGNEVRVQWLGTILRKEKALIKREWHWSSQLEVISGNR